MTDTDPSMPQSPFAALADYERRSLAHAPGVPEDIDARGLWRGIGFRLGERWLLSSIEEIVELLVMPALTSVPGSRAWVLGVANVRGNLVSVMDLGQFLYGRKTQLAVRSRVLLIRQPGAALGLLVDEVVGQRSLPADQLLSLDEEPEEALRPYVSGDVRLGGQVWGIFSTRSLIEASEFQQAAV